MKICALTMVYRDHWALSQWYMHYGRLLGFENLYVIAHGRDDEISEICPNAKVVTIPRDNLDRFDGARSEILNEFQISLTQTYDWIIRTDADELVCLDPNHYSSFQALFSKRWGPAVFALGLEVAEQIGDTPVDMNIPVLSKRTAAMFSGHYSKAWTVNSITRLMRHGVAVASAKGTAMPGAAWRDPQKTDKKFFRKFETFPKLGWERARQQAYEKLSRDPIREPGTGIVRARSHRFHNTTTLQD